MIGFVALIAPRFNRIGAIFPILRRLALLELHCFRPFGGVDIEMF
jgi:hypothetical protein